jgi:hypothetical protein
MQIRFAAGRQVGEVRVLTSIRGLDLRCRVEVAESPSRSVSSGQVTGLQYYTIRMLCLCK